MKKKGRLEIDYEVTKYASLYFDIHIKDVGNGVSRDKFRGISKVIIHDNYNPSGKQDYYSKQE